MCRSFDAKLFLLHVFAGVMPARTAKASKALKENDAIDLENARLDMEAFTQLDFLRKVKCATEIRAGYAVDEICREAGKSTERKNVRPAHPESYEALFHDVEVPNFFLDLRKDFDVAAPLRNQRLERAIGVIYRPDTELISHYFHARLPDQFDAILHYDHIRAVEPLERTAEWEMGEVEETFPSGL
jgi:hypothetical protein